MSPKCTSWLGHKYAARYDEKQIRDRSVDLNVLALLEKAADRTYVRDICVRCGHVVEKQP